MQVTHSKSLDEEIQGCCKNERLAQKRLYERFYGRMMGVSMRYAKHKEEASEILNNAFLKVFTNMDSFVKKGGKNIEAWIYRIVVNTAIDHLRSEARHQHYEIGNTIYTQASHSILADMAAEEILMLVQQLTPGYRAVFNLYVVEGFTHQEIADLLQIAEGTSKSNLAKARAKLQEMVLTNNLINQAL